MLSCYSVTVMAISDLNSYTCMRWIYSLLYCVDNQGQIGTGQKYINIASD